MASCVLCIFLLLQTAGQPQISPQLQIEAPPELAGIRARLESADSQLLAGLLTLVGLTTPGPPVPIVLAVERSEWAQQTPPWIVGFASDGPEMVVIFPARSPTYPHSTLDDVVRHELAHVLIGRASGHGDVPRWFNEGLAMAAEHGWRFQDQTQLLYHLVLGSAVSLHQIDSMFRGTQRDQTRAYALAGAFVRDLLEQHGSSMAAQIFAQMKDGASFDMAFAAVTRLTPAAAESRFWEQQRIWTNWIPIITESPTLWIAITLLALLAIRSRRKRDAAMKEEWEKEEEGQIQGPTRDGGDGADED
jgi:hypothetical protein